MMFEVYAEAGGRLLVIDNFFPPDILDGARADLERLRTRVHRNYVPLQKKGGSVSRYAIDDEAKMIALLYRSQSLRKFLEQVSGVRLLDCLPRDPHTYALYLYTEPGDHVTWHYDTSFYRGRRYTLLFGLIDNESCLFEYKINRRDGSRPAEAQAYAMKPGSLVFFDGDSLWHRVTKMTEGDGERVVITM
ncbi:MAG: 2OG-Fe(II) oxygenase [Planctomycetes bacterium]|nr:2OG-Fe(II) oxygenase [Planctomycetota bacterium]